MDAAGNAVSVTYTLNDWFGVKKVAPGTGIVLNNEMDDFTAKPGAPNMFGLVQGEANAVRPRQDAALQHGPHHPPARRRPPSWSSAAPAAPASSRPC